MRQHSCTESYSVYRLAQFFSGKLKCTKLETLNCFILLIGCSSAAYATHSACTTYVFLIKVFLYIVFIASWYSKVFFNHFPV